MTPHGGRGGSSVAVGNAFFRVRNTLFPILIVLAVLAGRPRVILGRADVDRALGLAGIVVALAGQAVRLVTIGYEYIERGGKDGKVYASRLVDGGVYAVVRNPMYVGNALIAAGMTLVAGSPIISLVVLPFFLFIYHTIVSSEEAYLGRQFGPAYQDYCARVPRWMPSLRRLGSVLAGGRYEWRRAVRKELSTMAGLFTGLVLLPVWRTFFLKGFDAAKQAAPRAVALELLVLVTFGVLVYFKQQRRFFYPATE